MEMAGALKAVAPYAGIGGIGLIVLYYLFRDFINRKIFPQLPAEKAYRLLRLFLSLTFVIAALAMLVGVVAHQMDRQSDAREAEIRQQTLREANAERARQEEDGRRAEEDRRRAEERAAWDRHHQEQIAELNRQRDAVQRDINSLTASIGARQSEANEAEQARLAELEQRATDSQTKLAQQQADDLRRQQADARLAAKEAREERARQEEETSRAKWCCQPDGVTKVCKIASQFHLEEGDSCMCSGLWGSGIACN